jgi:hypothetical protein
VRSTVVSPKLENTEGLRVKMQVHAKNGKNVIPEKVKESCRTLSVTC